MARDVTVDNFRKDAWFVHKIIVPALYILLKLSSNRRSIGVMETDRQEAEVTWRQRTARTLGLGAAYAAGFSPFAVFLGVTTASTDDYFGPSPTTYEVAVDPWSTLNLGVLGTATNLTTAGPFAIEATVHGIPAIQGDDQTKLFNHAADQYTLQYKYRQEYADTIKNLLIDDAAKKALYYELGWLAGVRVGSKILDRRVRERLSPVVTAGLATCALASSLSVMTRDHHNPQPGFPIAGLADTKTTSAVLLFGAQRAIPSIQNFIRKQEARGEEHVSQVIGQLEVYRGLMQQREENEKVILAYSDLHCSLPQTEVLKALATIYQPDTTLNAGDSTTNGLRIEGQCVEEAAEISDTTVVARGNHDSETTEEQQRAAGMKALDGKTVEVGGLTILGDGDPERTPAFGSGADSRYSETGETEEELGRRLGEQAQNDLPDILVVHQSKAAEAFLDDPANVAATDLVIWGHAHLLKKPLVYWRNDGSYATAQQLGTAGGIGQQRFDSLSTPLTTPTTDATVVAYRYNTDTEQVVLTQTITVTPQGEVTVSPWEPVVSPEEMLLHQVGAPRGETAAHGRDLQR